MRGKARKRGERRQCEERGRGERKGDKTEMHMEK